MSKRVEGSVVTPEDVKSGDVIKVVLKKKAIVKTFEGEVGIIDTDAQADWYRMIRCTDGETLWSCYWKTGEAEIILVKAVAEPHALDDAEVGDTFTLAVFNKEWLYTKIRDGFWVFEITNASGTLVDTGRVPDIKARRDFDDYNSKLVKLER